MECTVVNFLPYSMEEVKPGLIPERFYIPASQDGKPGILHVKDARSNLYIRDGRTYPISHSAEEVSKAIVNDYNIAQLEADTTAHPAVFWIFGKISATALLTDEKYKDTIAEAKQRQNKWFMRLIKRADDDWNKYKQHRMITDIQRYAAQNMGMTNKEWFHSPEPEEFVKCPACRSMVEITSAICHNCKFVVNKERAIKLGIVEEKEVEETPKKVDTNAK